MSSRMVLSFAGLLGYVETDSSHSLPSRQGLQLMMLSPFKAFAVSQTLAPLQNNGVIPAGAINQVLAKSSGSDYALKWLDLSAIATLLDQPVQNVASAPTVDVTPYSATTRNLLITGTTQIDGWAITAGQVFWSGLQQLSLSPITFSSYWNWRSNQELLLMIRALCARLPLILLKSCILSTGISISR
jgi:hypothetical protein